MIIRIQTPPPTASIADAARKFDIGVVMGNGIEPRSGSTSLIGPALTVRAPRGSIITVHAALRHANPGDVIVVDGDGDPSSALFGRLMAYEAERKGIAGIVIDGAVRDVSELARIELPVFSRYVAPAVGTNRSLGEVGKPIRYGSIEVRTGDLVVADRDGIVRVPSSLRDELLLQARSVVEIEAEYVARMDQGESITDIIGFTTLIDEAALSR